MRGYNRGMKRAYTLIELLVVMAIIGILTCASSIVVRKFVETVNNTDNTSDIINRARSTAMKGCIYTAVVIGGDLAIIVKEDNEPEIIPGKKAKSKTTPKNTGGAY